MWKKQTHMYTLLYDYLIYIHIASMKYKLHVEYELMCQVNAHG